MNRRHSRRSFLRGMGSAAFGLTLAGCKQLLGFETPSAPKPGAGAARYSHSNTTSQLPMRALGNTGERVTLLGLGGQGVLDSSEATDDEAIAIVKEAIRSGITYIDTAHNYGAGISETRIGAALDELETTESGVRERVFLATKSFSTTYSGVIADFGRSIDRLGTDYIDLYQVHNVGPNYSWGGTAPNAESLYEKDAWGRSAIDAFVRLRDQGRARFIGITGHHDPQFLLDVLNHSEAPQFDAVLIALNPADHHKKSFEAELLPVAEERKMAVIAMKVTGLNHLFNDIPDIADCLNYVYSLPISCAIVGFSDGTGKSALEKLEENVNITKDFTTPLTNEEMDALRAMATETPEGGPRRGDWFKVWRY